MAFFICVPEDIESATKVEKISMSANAQRISWAGGVPDLECNCGSCLSAMLFAIIVQLIFMCFQMSFFLTNLTVCHMVRHSSQLLRQSLVT